MSDLNTQWRFGFRRRGNANDESTGAPVDAPAGTPTDPVVKALLEKHIVTEDDVRIAAEKAIPGKDLWRLLLRVPGVNRDLVFAEAAELAGIPTCEVNAWEPPDDLVESILSLFGAETVQLILRAGLLPVEVLADEAVDEFTLSFATHDPTSQAAKQIAASLGLSSRFSFAPESVIHARVAGLGYAVPTPVQDLGAKAESAATLTPVDRPSAPRADTTPHLPEVESADSGDNATAAADEPTSTAESGEGGSYLASGPFGHLLDEVEELGSDSGTSPTEGEPSFTEVQTSASEGEPSVTEVQMNATEGKTSLTDVEPSVTESETTVDSIGRVGATVEPETETLHGEGEALDAAGHWPPSHEALPFRASEASSSIVGDRETSIEAGDGADEGADAGTGNLNFEPTNTDDRTTGPSSVTSAPEVDDPPTSETNQAEDSAETFAFRPYSEYGIGDSADSPAETGSPSHEAAIGDDAPASINADEAYRIDASSDTEQTGSSDAEQMDAIDSEAAPMESETLPYLNEYLQSDAEQFVSGATEKTDRAPEYEEASIGEAIPMDADEPAFVTEDVFGDLSAAIQIIEEDDEATSPDSPVEAAIDSAPTGMPARDEKPAVVEPTAKRDAVPQKQERKSDRSVADAPEVPRDRVVVMLLHKQAATREQVAEAVRIQREDQPKEALWRLLAQVPGVDRDAVYAEAASVYAFPMADISDPDPNFARLVMETFSEERREMLLSMGLLPLEYDMDTASGSAKLVFATHDPARPDVHRVLQQLKLGRFELKYAPESEIRRITNDIFPRRNEYLDRMTDDPLAMDLGTAFEAEKGELIDEEALEAEISRSTLINLFEATLVEATRSGASDIHIFPNPQRKVEIHFRTDGRLQRWHVEDKVHPEAFLAVVKDNSVNIDRFERDAAQDGFIQRRIDEALIRFRVSVLPIATASQEIRAESIVIRVLDDRKVLTDLRKLGMLDVALERFDRAIRQPHGMVILTGPTGSGKSTTLVAALHQVVTPAVNVLTVEDPVEYIIKGVRQIKLSHKLNLEQALRSILRHDPDVVMVGEMRDKETAELAIKLANTGHLTFSTLHTNDAPSAVSRLYKMGIEPFLIAYAINLVVAQRLIRTLCPECKVVDDDPDKVLMKSVGFTDEQIETHTIYKASHNRSCRTCKGAGYKGRRAMCETLYFSRDIRHLVVESGDAIDEDAIREMARKEGMLTLLDSAREIVKMGETSVEELIRVTSSE